MLRAAASVLTRTCAIPLLLAALLAALLAGCGGGDGNSGTSKEVQALRIEQFQSDIRSFCTSGRHDLVGAADPLGTVISAVDNLIKIYRDDPKATYRLAKVDRRGDKLGLREAPIRTLLTESADDLDKKCGKYGRDQARRLRAI